MPKTLRYEKPARDVLKQVHPDAGIKGDALAEITEMVLFWLRIIGNGCDVVNKHKNTPILTLDSKTIRTAVMLTLPRDLSKHSIADGTRAVAKYTASVTESQESKKQSKSISKAKRSGLEFPPKRVYDDLLGNTSSFQRRQAEAEVFIAGVIEYLVADLFELSGNRTFDNGRKRINVRDISLAISNDNSLSKLFENVYVPGGVDVHIEPEVLKKK